MKIDKIYSATSRIGSQLTTQHLISHDCSKLLKVCVYAGRIRFYESLLTQIPHNRSHTRKRYRRAARNYLNKKGKMARPTGFEPVTPAFGGQIQPLGPTHI